MPRKNVKGKVVDKACEAVADPIIEDNTENLLAEIKELLEQIKKLIEKMGSGF
jgi:DNA replication initiation complex subunit (GINS family)